MKGTAAAVCLAAIACLSGVSLLHAATAPKQGRLFERTGREPRAREAPLRASPGSGLLLPGDGSLVASTVFLALSDLRRPADGPPALDQRQLSLIEQMAHIGEVEGFRVVVAVPERDSLSRAALAGRRDLEVVAHGGADDLWLEDEGELDERGDALLPARFADASGLVRNVLHDRIQRMYPGAPLPDSLPDLQTALVKVYRSANFHSVGRVEELREPSPVDALARARAGSVRFAASYFEGGNQLIGRLATGEPYAVIGKDSVSASRAVLEARLGRPVGEPEALRTIAGDLRVSPDQLYPVEQPGAFHLDLSMLPVGPKAVVLDDAEADARLIERWLREDLALVSGGEAERRQLEAYVHMVWEAARERAAAQQMTARDLRAAGFAVHRMAGNFREAPRKMNLLNAFLATNPRGERYAIVFGGDPRAEEYVADMLLRALPTELVRIHFLDERVSVPSGTGGIRCRVRALGSQVAPLGPRASAVAAPALAHLSAGPQAKTRAAGAIP